MRGEDDYSFCFNYILLYLENNIEDINFCVMDVNDFEVEWGLSINDCCYIINIIFMYYLVENLLLIVVGLI